MGTPIFETETCSRCGGSGSYSYCQAYGTRCFKCGGKTTVLTKRGAAAQAFLAASCSKPAADLVAGDKVMEAAGPLSAGGWAAVTGVRPGAPGDAGVYRQDGTVDYGFIVETTRTRHHTTPAALFRVAQSAEDRAAKIAAALAYQAGLTKAGTPRKAARVPA